MNAKEMEVAEAMASVGRRYFSDVENVTYLVEATERDCVEAVVVTSKDGIEVTLRYGDTRVLEHKHRGGLVPLIAHELAHSIDPVDPERVMRQRLPPELMALWDKLVEGGHAVCSMKRQL